MIHFKQNISQEDALWILSRAWEVFNHRIAHPTLSVLMEAHNKMFEEQVGIPSCSCEYLATFNVWRSRISQYENELRAIANPPVVEETVKPRGRKKNG